jgi:hypothetical protein
MNVDRSYFMRRAAQERSAAANATAGRAREAHELMAEHYRDLAEADGKPPAA